MRGKDSAVLMQTRDASIIAELEEVNRQRALTNAESAQLLDAILRTQRAAGKLRLFWTPKEDRTLRQAVLRRKTVGQIALMLQRTERAVWQRMQRLRKLGKLGYISPENGIGRYPRQGSKADWGREGV
jgi:hypothetical protein